MSGADLEYQRMLSLSGNTGGTGLDGARLEQIDDVRVSDSGFLNVNRSAFAADIANSSSLIGTALAASIASNIKPTGVNQASELNAFLSSGLTRLVRLSGAFVIATTVTIPAGVKVDARGAKFTTTTATIAVSLGAGSSITGLEVDGSSLATKGINGTAGAGARVEGCKVHDITGPGIDFTNVTDYIVRGNDVRNVTAQGINLTFSQRGVVSGNIVDTANHGIQWWGGDAALTSVVGTDSIVISANVVRNIGGGGIWGSLGAYISVTGNSVTNCGDVGIDFEGCQDSTATGNSVRNATNSGLSVFFASTRIRFTGNTVINDIANGYGFKAFSAQTNTFIAVDSNTFRTIATAIATDTNALTDSLLTNNIAVISAGFFAILLNASRTLVRGNRATLTAVGTGINSSGGCDMVFDGNTLDTSADTTDPASDSGGIHLLWTAEGAGTFQSQRNRVTNNVLRGFVKGIYDNCYGSTLSFNLIENNETNAIRRRSGDWRGVINGNRAEGTPAIASAVTVV